MGGHFGDAAEFAILFLGGHAVQRSEQDSHTNVQSDPTAIFSSPPRSLLRGVFMATVIPPGRKLLR